MAKIRRRRHPTDVFDRGGGPITGPGSKAPRLPREPEPLYDLAQFCLNGHLVTGFARTEPRQKERFCSTCGARTITQCQRSTCQAPIRGYRTGEGEMPQPVMREAAYCYECSRAYPWTQARIKAAHELIELCEGLTDDEKRELNDSLKDITTENPRTEIAAIRIKRIVVVARTGGGELVYKLVVDLASESAKKILTGT